MIVGAENALEPNFLISDPIIISDKPFSVFHKDLLHAMHVGMFYLTESPDLVSKSVLL